MPGNVLLKNRFALHPVGVNILVAPYSGAFHSTRYYRKSGGRADNIRPYRVRKRPHSGH